MNKHEKINYVEFPAKDIEATKAFFSAVFGWSFIDYGPEYTAFDNEGIDGGFFKSDLTVSTNNGSVLIGQVLSKQDDLIAHQSGSLKISEPDWWAIYPTSWRCCDRFSPNAFSR